MDDLDLIFSMLDFCEENWDAFLQRCVESGYTEDQVIEAVEDKRNSM